MKAVVKDGVTSLEKMPVPELGYPFDTLVKVTLSGVCKTDLQVADGLIPTDEPRILGHEFCGFVSRTTGDRVCEGDFVACNPIQSDRTMLGVDHQGTFSEYVLVPSEQCFEFDRTKPKLAAYIEPISASMAPLNNDVVRSQREGAILGESRIARLTSKILNSFGCNLSLLPDPFEVNRQFDYIIETTGDGAIINRALELVRNRGIVILKSRSPVSVELDLLKVVKKDLQVAGAYYYPFQETIDFTLDNCELFGEFFGQCYSLEEWRKSFSESRTERRKIFLEP